MMFFTNTWLNARLLLHIVLAADEGLCGQTGVLMLYDLLCHLESRFQSPSLKPQSYEHLQYYMTTLFLPPLQICYIICHWD